MPRLIPFRLAAACALALSLSLSLAAVACGRKGVTADLRVVGSGGKVLAEETVQTGDHLDQDQPEGDLLRRRHRRQRQVGRRSRAPPRWACWPRRRRRPRRCGRC